MPLSLTDMLGSNATSTATTLTITFADLKNSQDVVYLDDPTTATDQQKVAAIVKYLFDKTLPNTDVNGNAVVDKTVGIVAQQAFNPRTFETREDESQIRHDFNFAVYTSDPTNFDPDNVI